MIARMSHYQPPSDPYHPRFAGIATLMRMPHVPDPTGLDIAMAGVTYDLGTWIRPGARSAARDRRRSHRAAARAARHARRRRPAGTGGDGAGRRPRRRPADRRRF